MACCPAHRRSALRAAGRTTPWPTTASPRATSWWAPGLVALVSCLHLDSASTTQCAFDNAERVRQVRVPAIRGRPLRASTQYIAPRPLHRARCVAAHVQRMCSACAACLYPRGAGDSAELPSLACAGARADGRRGARRAARIRRAVRARRAAGPAAAAHVHADDAPVLVRLLTPAPCPVTPPHARACPGAQLRAHARQFCSIFLHSRPRPPMMARAP